MDPQDPFSSPSPTRRSAELQGPRPSPLRVNKDSHRIKKPPIPPHSHHHHLFHQQPLPPPHPASTSLNPQPVIIYSVSPKVIHTTVSDFMHLVQSLTGSTPAGAGGAASSGDISPAARFASIESTSPSQRERERSSFFSAAAAVNAATTTYGIEQSTPLERERERWSSSASASTTAAASSAVHGIEHSTPFERERERSSYHSSSNTPVAGGGGGAALFGGLGEDEISRILDEGSYFSHNYFPGILSPAPATLPPASPPGLFSPAVADPFSNMFIPSPSTLFSAPMVSPSPSSSYSHFFNSSFFDF